MTEAEHRLQRLEKAIADAAALAHTYDPDTGLRARAFVASLAGSTGVILSEEVGSAVYAVIRPEGA